MYNNLLSKMYNNLLAGTTSSASARDKIESDVDLEGEIEFLKTYKILAGTTSFA